MLKKSILILLLVGFAFFASNFYRAEAYNQNPNLNLGSTGSLEGVLPPPGFYFTLYNAYYTASSFRDGDGKKLPGSNEIDVVVLVPQFTYVSSQKIFGLTPGLQAICALQGLDVDSDLGFESGRSGFGDLCVGPFLGGNFKPTESSIFFYNAEVSFYLPIGRYDNKKAINPGANLYTVEPWINFTWLLPHGFEISSRLHYTYNAKNHDFGPESFDMQPGQAFHMNYAATKSVFNENFRLGVCGYYLKQLNEDKIEGKHVPDSKEQVFAIGPTAVLNYKGTFFSLNTMYETEVENRTKGIKSVLRIIYKF
ncbi:MAG: transporter [Desulfobacterales bacterium]|nr:transporter [Desulfobacterales bacterium]